jgi:hypothetical protein
VATNRDFNDLFCAFNAHDVRYLVVGFYAVTYHARPRFTQDLDLWVDPAPDNAQRVRAALADFGAPVRDVSAEELARPGLVVQLGVAPNRIDVLTGIEGVGFAEAWPARVAAHYAETPIHVIGREHLIRNKRALGRPQDLLDVQELERSPGRQPGGPA